MKSIGLKRRVSRVRLTGLISLLAVVGAGSWLLVPVDAEVLPADQAETSVSKLGFGGSGTPCCLDEWQSQYNCPAGERWMCLCVGLDCTGCSPAAGGVEVGCVPDSTLCFQ